MRFRKFILISLFLLPLFLTNSTNAFGFEEDEQPQVTARVARINVLSGDVQVRRADSRDWERATLNLPLVEGDEIASGAGARLEIQFDIHNYLRLSENAYLKITTLRDEGVAVSLPQGTMSLRVFEFNKDKTFFEIDAPKTTVAVQKAGMYRIDAGDSASTDIRVTVTEEGQARIYSENNGFTLRNGRSAKIFLAGNLEGESEVADASRFIDDFTEWTLERDAVIAKRLKDSYYDKYYDRDIYGADDLSEYGEWVYTRKHGYVWKPYRNSIARYADWSPYRYGHWRWIPPFGWVWVNDEPWGWATYHHGRWVWIDNYWVWSPYAYYRPRRSWWYPALVVIGNWGGNVCWYPLPWNYGYYNYNSHYHNNVTIINNNTTVIINPTPTPATPVITQLPGKENVPPFQVIPPGGVVSVAASEFGRTKKGFQTAPLSVAEQVLVKVPDDKKNPPVLPSIKELNGKVSKEILAEAPKTVKVESPIKTGVIDRQVGVSMNDRLQKERVLDNRPPLESGVDTPVRNESPTKTEVRDTGAVKRQPPTPKQTDESDTPIRQPSQNTTKSDEPVRPTGGGKTERSDAPVKTPRNDPPVRVPKENPPVYTPPTRQPPQQQPPTKQQPQPQPKKEETKPPLQQRKTESKDG